MAKNIESSKNTQTDYISKCRPQIISYVPQQYFYLHAHLYYMGLREHRVFCLWLRPHDTIFYIFPVDDLSVPFSISWHRQIWCCRHYDVLGSHSWPFFTQVPRVIKDQGFRLCYCPLSIHGLLMKWNGIAKSLCLNAWPIFRFWNVLLNRNKNE